MKVQPISNTQPQFNASIAKTKDYSNLLNYLNKYREAAPPCYNSTNDLHLINSFEKAISNFPTDAVLKFSIMYRNGEMFNARGVVESQYAKYTDTEPARSDSVVPIPNIIKRILNPENKEQFNTLMGNKDEKARNIWWDYFIDPIWKSIEHNFYEDTVYKRDCHPDFDFIFRKQN